MSKFGFISGLDDKPKSKYQLFEVGMGFERAQAFIPLDKADLFQEEALKIQPKSKTSLVKLAEQFGGHVD